MKKMLIFSKIFIFLFFTFIIVNMSFYVYAFITPKFSINTKSNILFYDINENDMFEESKNNSYVKLSDINDNVKNAIVSIEDKNFYKHKGFDYLRILKAFYKNIISNKVLEGASTITQQYVKNMYLDFDKTFKRKIKEAWLTLRVETHYSKDEILEGYLNTINYGGVFGIENASKYYFGKSSKDLTLAEASMLAGIPKSPANYEPIGNSKNSKERQLAVLNSMVRNNYIKKEEADLAYNTKLVYKKEDNENANSILYYQDAVIQELKNIKNIPKTVIDSEGLKIYTYLDPKAEKSLETSIKANVIDKEIQVSGIIMDPENGHVLAIQGGKNYEESQYNRALNSKRQVGSTMKPILYYTALSRGMTATSKFRSEKTNFIFSNNDIYDPSNFANKYPNKDITMIQALAYSDNIYAVKTHLFLGEEALVNTADKIGIKDLSPIPSLALGSMEITLMDMVSAYSSFANEGYKIKPHFIKKIIDGHGNTLYEANDSKEKVLNENYVYILNDMLKATYDQALIDYDYPTCYSIRNKMTHPYSVKTGTTDSDYLIFGYNKDVIVGIWAGYDDNSELSPTGSGFVKNIWIDSIEKYLEDKDSTPYKKPDDVIGVLVNPITGNIATNQDKNKRIVYYIKGTEPR